LNLTHADEFSRAVVAELKSVREAQGLSQGDVARATGLSRSAVTMIENGQRNPTLIVCQAVAAALGVALSTILRRAEKALGLVASGASGKRHTGRTR
jgi:transcriptional regulator with XRE-family HTH domain